MQNYTIISNTPTLLRGDAPFWTVHESTSLLLGKDPDLIDPEALKADEDRSVFAWFYAYLRTLIGRAQNAKEIPNPDSTADSAGMGRR